MAKKKAAPKLNNSMTPAQYWEWKCSIEELKASKLNDKRVHLEQEIMNKELENKKLKLALYRGTIQSARSSVVLANENFEKTKQRIEEEMGISLQDCTIDPYTYEVKKLEE